MQTRLERECTISKLSTPTIPSSFPDFETVYHILEDDRRKYAIRVLTSTSKSEGISTTNLALSVAALELNIPEQEVTSTDFDTVYIELYQIHLPVLEKHGIARICEESGHVFPTQHTEYILHFVIDDTSPSSALAYTPRFDDAISKLYTVLTAVATMTIYLFGLLVQANIFVVIAEIMAVLAAYTILMLKALQSLKRGAS